MLPHPMIPNSTNRAGPRAPALDAQRPRLAASASQRPFGASLVLLTRYVETSFRRVSLVRARKPKVARLIAGGILAACVALGAVATDLQPDAASMGTHQQLGLAPCSMVMFTGYPCPTCGMTTAFAHVARGELAAALAAQPAGLAAALVVLLVGCASAVVAISGKVWVVNELRVSPIRITIFIVLFVLGAWGYKLMTGIYSGRLPVVF